MFGVEHKMKHNKRYYLTLNRIDGDVLIKPSFFVIIRWITFLNPIILKIKLIQL
jgi:hypothetical protein